MVLFLCLWQHNVMQFLIAFLSWGMLYLFLTISLTHITLAGHVGPCCNTHGSNNFSSCKQRLGIAVRALLELCYAVVIPAWGFYLLVTGRTDVESHAFLYITALGYQCYSIFWAVKEFGWVRSSKFPYFNQKSIPSFFGKNKLLHLVQCLLATCIVAAGIEALSFEMTNWGNSAIPLMMDINSKNSWNKPTNVQKKALSHHLLAKSSEIARLLTLNLLVHEFPNVFFNVIKLLRVTSYKASQIKQSRWKSDNGRYPLNTESSMSMGTSAWRRERGMIKPPYMQHFIVEDVLSKIHRVAFVIFRIFGGFATLHWILKTEALVRDTFYVSSALLYHGIALYLFGGIIAYTAKRSKSQRLGLRKSISWQLATAVSDDWLNYN